MYSAASGHLCVTETLKRPKTGTNRTFSLLRGHCSKAVSRVARAMLGALDAGWDRIDQRFTGLEKFSHQPIDSRSSYAGNGVFGELSFVNTDG
eukprot:scaffold45166_cov73-Phaeocystis_antarctica.AAC.2